MKQVYKPLELTVKGEKNQRAFDVCHDYVFVFCFLIFQLIKVQLIKLPFFFKPSKGYAMSRDSKMIAMLISYKYIHP